MQVARNIALKLEDVVLGFGRVGDAQAQRLGERPGDTSRELGQAIVDELRIDDGPVLVEA